MKAPSLETIEAFLVAGSLEQTEARRRAPLVFEDFQWIGFDTLSMEAHSSPFCSPFCIPEYRFGDTGFSIDFAEQADVIKTEWIGGTGMDRGHLQLFSRASVIGRKLIPYLWHQPGKLRDSLRNPAQHLDTVEEIWWLDRWLDPQGIQSSVILRDDSDKDVDWSFTLGDGALSINLEVKRLCGDCLRHTRGRTFKIDVFDRFCKKKVIQKFRKSEPTEVNVLALSLFGEIDRDVQMIVGEWLSNRQDVIDAVIITSREARRKSCFDFHFRNQKAQYLRPFLREPTYEDQSLIFSLIVPIDIPGLPKMPKQ